MTKLLSHPLSPVEQLLLEACHLLEEFSEFFNDPDFKTVASPELFEWWDENKPKPKRKPRPGTKTTIIDMTTGKRT